MNKVNLSVTAKAISLALLGGSSVAVATPISVQGTATSENAIAIGTDSFATAVDGVAEGKGAVATGQGFSREDFAKKAEENKAITDALKDKQNEVNQLNNNKAVTESTQTELQKQIDDMANQQKQVEEKIAQRDELTNQKNSLEDKSKALQDAVEQAQKDLDNILQEGKNIYLNFTQVLSNLEWDKLTQPNGREELATDLKNKLEADFPDLADKYSLEKYTELVSGYANKQAGYEGSLESITNHLNVVTKADRRYQVLGEDQVSLASVRTLGTDILKNVDYIALVDSTAQKKLKDETVGYPNGGLWEVNYNIRGINSDVSYVAQYLSRTYKENTSETKLAYNTVLLAAESSAKLINDGVGDYIGAVIVESTNNGVPPAIFGDHWLSFKLKTNDGRFVDPFVNDFNLTFISGLESNSETNQNTLTSAQIDLQDRSYKALQEFYNEIDWDDPKAAYDLADYKAQIERSLELAKKVDQHNTVYKEILAERDKPNPDQSFIDRKTAEVLNLQKALFADKENTENLLNEYRLVYTDKANEYYNYAKEDTDATLERMKNELLKYDSGDSLVVEVQKKAKELEDAVNKAKEEAEKNQKEIDEISKKIDEFGVTAEEDKINDKKKELEDQLDKAKEKQAEIDKQLEEKNKELDDLKEKLANSSLKDLGLRSQAQGSNAFASGDDSIAVGTNSTVTANEGIAIGKNSTVTANNGIVVGANSSVSAPEGVVMGNNSSVSGVKSIAVGNDNVVTSEQAIAIGNNNKIESDRAVALGNNIAIARGFEGAVVLGDGSAPAKANPTSSIQIRGKTHRFAGTNPTSTVSVGAPGKERQITNVAAGRVTATSTDAINGSQLYAVVDAVNNIKSTVVNNDNRVNILENKVNNVDKKINRVDKNLRAGIAGSAAIAGLPQVRKDGKSMLSAAAGNYRGQSAIAVGYSRASDNGKVLFKLSGSANTQGDVVSSVGIGYEW